MNWNYLFVGGILIAIQSVVANRALAELLHHPNILIDVAFITS